MFCSLEEINDELTRPRQQRNQRGIKQAFEDHSLNLESLQLIYVGRTLSCDGLTGAPERPKAPGAPWQRGCPAWCCIHPRHSSCPGSGYREERTQGHRRRWIWPCSAPGGKNSNRGPMMNLY